MHITGPSWPSGGFLLAVSWGASWGLLWVPPGASWVGASRGVFLGLLALARKSKEKSDKKSAAEIYSTHR